MTSKETSQFGNKSPAPNPLLKTALSAGWKRVVTLRGYVGETTDYGVEIYPELSSAPFMVIPIVDIMHVSTPADPLEPSTLLVREDGKVIFRADVGGDQMPDLSVATAAHIFEVVARKQKGPAGTAACASSHCGNFHPASDAYSSCYNLCQCLNETDNSAWTCVKEAASSSWDAKATRRVR